MNPATTHFNPLIPETLHDKVNNSINDPPSNQQFQQHSSSQINKSRQSTLKSNFRNTPASQQFHRNTPASHPQVQTQSPPASQRFQRFSPRGFQDPRLPRWMAGRGTRDLPAPKVSGGPRRRSKPFWWIPFWLDWVNSPPSLVYFNGAVLVGLGEFAAHLRLPILVGLGCSLGVRFGF